MAIDFWGLGLQAINVLILVWLLSRVFWRPVSAAISRRQEESQTLIEASKAAQSEADATLAELIQARAGIASEREAALAAARAEAETLTKAAVAKAQSSAEQTLAAARTTIDRDTESARKANAAKASELSLSIATKLLERLNGPTVQTAFQAQLIEAIGKLSDADRVSLTANAEGIEIVTATEPDSNKKDIETAIRHALGGPAQLRWITEPNLIAGLELRSAHFVLHNSWQADLAQVQQAVTDAD